MFQKSKSRIAEHWENIYHWIGCIVTRTMAMAHKCSLQTYSAFFTLSIHIFTADVATLTYVTWRVTWSSLIFISCPEHLNQSFHQDSAFLFSVFYRFDPSIYQGIRHDTALAEPSSHKSFHFDQSILYTTNRVDCFSDRRDAWFIGLRLEFQGVCDEISKTIVAYQMQILMLNRQSRHIPISHRKYNQIWTQRFEYHVEY